MSLWCYQSFVYAQEIKTGWIHQINTNFMEYTRSIKKTNDNELLILSYQWAASDYSDNKIHLLKLNLNGEKLWSKKIDFHIAERPNDFEILNNNEIVLTGNNWTAKIDTNGHILWRIKHFDDIDEQKIDGIGNDIEVYHNSIYIIGTKTYNAFAIKLFFDGEIDWKYVYPYYDNAWIEGKVIGIRNANEIILGADVYNVEGGDFVYSNAGLYFLDSLGVIQSFNIYECDLDECYSIANPLEDIEVGTDKIYILGRTHITDHYEDAYIMAVNFDKDKIWIKTYDDGKVFGKVNDLYIDEYENILGCGSANSNDFWIFKCNPDGGLLWNYNFSSSECQGTASSIVQIDSMTYVFAGHRTQGLGGDRAYVIQIKENTNSNVSEQIAVINNYSFIHNYPNPFNTRTYIEYSIFQKRHVQIKIYDLLGRKLITLVDDIKQSGKHETIFDASEYPSGIYYVVMEADNNFLCTHKILLLK